MTRNLRLPSSHAGKAARTDALAAFLLPIGSAGTALDGLNKRKSRKTASGPPLPALFKKLEKTLPPLPGNAPVREQIILPYPP